MEAAGEYPAEINMGFTEILLILLGILAFVASFILPENMGKENSKEVKIPEEKIAGMFIESANSGLKTEFWPKIKLLEKLAKDGKTPFSKEALSEYLSGYNGEMVSHSEEYRKAYAPAYRVVLEKLSEDLQ